MKEKIITDDGSFSLYDTSLNEYYHSKKGAYSESIHVYINNGVNYWLKNNPDIPALLILSKDDKESLIYVNGFDRFLNLANNSFF